MKQGDDNYRFLLCYFIVSLCLLSVLLGRCVGSCGSGSNGVHDTTVIERWDTTYIEKHDTVPMEKVKLVVDYVTIPCPNTGSGIDSVSTELQPDSGMVLPVVQKVYSDDSTYMAYISGVEVAGFPKLDSINVRQRIVTHDVIKNTIINNTKPVTFGLQVGAGYGVFSKKPDIYVGVGCQFNF